MRRVQQLLILAALAALPLGVSAAAEDVTPDAAAASPGNPLGGLSLDNLTETTQRPLFARTRRGPETEAPPEPQEAPPPAQDSTYRLVGVIAAGDDTVVMLSEEATGAIRRIRAGDTVDGWRVTVVDPRTVMLQNGAERRTLTMFATPSAPAEAPSPPPDNGAATDGDGQPPDDAQDGTQQ
jgi:general secretion pathway protein N